MKQKLLILLLLTCVGTVAMADEKPAAAPADTTVALTPKQIKKEYGRQMKLAHRKSHSQADLDFAGARAALAAAAAVADHSADPFYWLQVGDAEFNYMEHERNKPATAGKATDMKVFFDAAWRSFEAFDKAYAINTELGVPSKKQRKALQRAYFCYEATAGFHSYAAYYHNNKQWAEAHTAFDRVLAAAQSPMLDAYAEIDDAAAARLVLFRADTVISQAALNRAIDAQMMGNDSLVIANFAFLKGRGYQEDLVYKSLAGAYLTVGDTAAYRTTLEEGARLLPDQPWYPRQLLSLFIEREDFPSAARYIDVVVQSDTANASLRDVKGRLCEVTGDIAGAVESYRKAIDLDSTVVTYWSNLGRLYYNQGIAVEADLKRQLRFDEAERQSLALFREAQPYYEQAFQLDSARQDKSIAESLRAIYYMQFISPDCVNGKQLVKAYNQVSIAYGLPRFQ